MLLLRVQQERVEGEILRLVVQEMVPWAKNN